MRVFDLMDASPVAVEVPSQRDDLIALFSKHRVRGFPVVKAGSRKLAGVVLRSDLLRSPTEHQVALLMNPNPWTMYMQAPLREAVQALIQTQMPLLPVVTGSNDLVGSVTTDACLHALSEQTGRVATQLRRRLIPIHETTPANVALYILRATRTNALPVLDDDAALSGIITDGDLLAHAVRGDSPAGLVREYMVKPVVAVKSMSGVADAARIMLDNGWHQLPVVDDNGLLVDLVTDLDLLGALV